jgi:hypothetical protein
MNPDEARKIILRESREGIAYTSRMGDYSTKDHFYEVIDAIRVLNCSLRGKQEIERELFAALFVLGNQVEGNLHGALAKGIPVPEWLWDEGIVALNEALYAIFEDYDNME